MVLRTVTNIGDPLIEQDGSPLVGVKVKFTIVDANGNPTDFWDTISGERVISPKDPVLTDDKGEFSIDLVPNDRGDIPTWYKCDVSYKNVRSFIAAVPSGAGALQWIEMKGNNLPLTNEAYATPLIIQFGSTVPITGFLTDNVGDPIAGGIAGYEIAWMITDSNSNQTTYHATIDDPVTCQYSINLTALTVGRYTAKLHVTTSTAQITIFQPFPIEVLA